MPWPYNPVHSLIDLLAWAASPAHAELAAGAVLAVMALARARRFLQSLLVMRPKTITGTVHAVPAEPHVQPPRQRIRALGLAIAHGLRDLAWIAAAALAGFTVAALALSAAGTSILARIAAALIFIIVLTAVQALSRRVAEHGGWRRTGQRAAGLLIPSRAARRAWGAYLATDRHAAMLLRRLACTADPMARARLLLKLAVDAGRMASQSRHLPWWMNPREQAAWKGATAELCSLVAVTERTLTPGGAREVIAVEAPAGDQWKQLACEHDRNRRAELLEQIAAPVSAALDARGVLGYMAAEILHAIADTERAVAAAGPAAQGRMAAEVASR